MNVLIRMSPAYGKVSTPEELACPRCTAANLHHECVTIFSRIPRPDNLDEDGSAHTEDGGLVLKTEIAGDEGRAPSVKSIVSHGRNNPSARRNGLVIRFSCEGCDARPLLAIWQHKGTTMLEWLP
jgi:hypothetical protein